MKYTVVWLPAAERELTELYLQLPAQMNLSKTFSSAANEIDLELKNQPLDPGRNSDELRGILFHTPLAVAYRLYPEDRLVQVTAVWLHDSANPNV